VICLFAKAPTRGKTRLAASLGDDRARALACAFLEDSWSPLAAEPGAIVAWDGEASEAPCEPSRVWPQGEGDLGARLTRIVRRALAIEPWIVVIGSDSPGLPRRLLEDAVQRLRTDACDLVLGPAEDGGFYLLGCRTLPNLDDIPWSTERTLEITLERAMGLRVALLDRWFDVDVVEDLRRLKARIDSGEVHAPATAALLGMTTAWTE